MHQRNQKEQTKNFIYSKIMCDVFFLDLEGEKFGESLLRYSEYNQLLVILRRVVREQSFIERMRVLCELSRG